MSGTEYKVRLAPISAMRTATTSSDILDRSVIFHVTPTLSESGSVDYASVSPVHIPGSIQVYKHTNSRTFEISAHLVSRNIADARKNMRYLQILRSWRYPYFGLTDTVQSTSTTTNQSMPMSDTPVATADESAIARAKGGNYQLRGAPPEVLYLWAYSPQNDRTVNGSSTSLFMNINRVPVVITSLNITYPDDVDYLPVFAEGSTPDKQTQAFPKKMDITVSLAETHSPREYELFDLTSFRNGTLSGF